MLPTVQIPKSPKDGDEFVYFHVTAHVSRVSLRDLKHVRLVYHEDTPYEEIGGPKGKGEPVRKQWLVYMNGELEGRTRPGPVWEARPSNFVARFASKLDALAFLAQRARDLAANLRDRARSAQDDADVIEQKLAEEASKEKEAS